MRRSIVLILFICAIAFYACGSKDIDDPATTQTKLQRHTWVLDSIRMTVDGMPSTYLPDENSLLTFGADSFTGAFFISADGTFSYNINEPDTVYFWLPAQQLDSNQYFIVNKVNNNSLVTTYTLDDFNQTTVSIDYFHAK